jgi:hypothetical protein
MADQTSWTERLGFLSPKCVQHTIGEGEFEQTLNFYPVSIKVAFRLKTLAKPLAKAIGVLFNKNMDDTRQESRSYTDEKTGEQGQHLITEAIDIDLAKYRDERKDGAIQQAIEALTDPLNQAVVAELIMDSLRDDCPRRPESADINAFMDSITLDVLIGMLTGVAKANFGVLEGNVLQAVKDRAGAAFDLENPTMQDGSTSPTTSSS